MLDSSLCLNGPSERVSAPPFVPPRSDGAGPWFGRPCRPPPSVHEGHAGARRNVPGAPPPLSRRPSVLRVAARLRGRLPLPRRPELHAGAPRLGEADRDHLLGGPRPMLALADVMHLRAHELARLRRRGLPLALVLFSSLHCALLRHHDLFLLWSSGDAP